jgi:hypothetical protein
MSWRTGHCDPPSRHYSTELARAFVAQKFDLKFLLEAITSTKGVSVEQSRQGAGSAVLPPFTSRGLTGEQLYDSLFNCHWPSRTQQVGMTCLSDPMQDPRQEFLTKFGQQTSKPTEYETSIIQALTLMNGNFVEQATRPRGGELLTAVVEAPFLNERGRVETIYLATLSRRPTEKEMEQVLAFLVKGGSGDNPSEARTEAVADLFWALLNSAEFVFNH